VDDTELSSVTMVSKVRDEAFMKLIAQFHKGAFEYFLRNLRKIIDRDISAV